MKHPSRSDRGNAPDGAGGGQLTITKNLNFTGNNATIKRDPTDVNFQGNTGDTGGAIEAESDTTVSLTGGTISDNRAPGGGGGLALLGGGPATITNSTISHNTAGVSGGGIFYVALDSLSVTGTTITDNNVIGGQDGGGGILFIGLSGATGTITGSTISGNTVTPGEGASAVGGGISSQGAGIAAAGLNSAATLTLQNGTTVTGNTPTNCLLSPATVTNCVN